jgi:hypothetical protein
LDLFLPINYKRIVHLPLALTMFDEASKVSERERN